LKKVELAKKREHFFTLIFIKSGLNLNMMTYI
jgi:hypothetical protein